MRLRWGRPLTLARTGESLGKLCFMSAASLQAFRSIVLSDDAVRSQVHAAAGVDDIVSLAASHGHEIDKPALLREHARAIHAAPDSALQAINSWGDALIHAFGAEAASTEV